MIKKYSKIILLVWLAIIIVLPQLVLAENAALGKLQEVGATKGPYQVAGEFGLSVAIGTIISSALALVGSIFLILMIYAGYNWMTARGEEEKVSKAKDTINRAIIGIIIVVGAYAIWRFIFDRLF
ncbi:MAG: hypothetical protein WCV70_01345 [Patescibacteria group bacterium]|jgi:lysylphosphatidylglycerol synthetase-like protein (DUF2156 family)